MKKLFLYLILLVGGSCQPKEPSIELPECTCLDYEVRPQSIMCKGIFFYNSTLHPFPYTIRLTEPISIPFVSNNLFICEDSTTKNQIQNKQIKDSTLVTAQIYIVMYGVEMKKNTNCRIKPTNGDSFSYVCRIVEIDKQ